MPWVHFGLSTPAYPAIAAAAAALLILLCVAVVAADFRWRRIPNAYCLAVAVLAIPYWFGCAGVPGLMGLVHHLVWPLVVAVPLCLLFALRVLGGGDVKLIVAMTLWVDAQHLPVMLMITAVSGGLLALAIRLPGLLSAGVNAAKGNRANGNVGRADTESVPYGAAIVAGGLFALGPAFIRLASLSWRAIF